VARAVGNGILRSAPWLMKGLSVAGTAAMFLVGGGILAHGVPAVGHAIEAFSHSLAGPLATVASMLLDALLGIVAGAVVLAVVTLAQRFSRRRAPA
jgi:predicted DNA repair protein MutK